MSYSFKKKSLFPEWFPNSITHTRDVQFVTEFFLKLWICTLFKFLAVRGGQIAALPETFKIRNTLIKPNNLVFLLVVIVNGLFSLFVERGNYDKFFCSLKVFYPTKSFLPPHEPSRQLTAKFRQNMDFEVFGRWVDLTKNEGQKTFRWGKKLLGGVKNFLLQKWSIFIQDI